jgi:hypothetical protein
MSRCPYICQDTELVEFFSVTTEGPYNTDATKTVRTPPFVRTSVNGDGIVLTDLNSSQTFQLGRIASMVWLSLRAEISISAVVEALAQRYDCSVVGAAAATSEVIQRLRQRDLLDEGPKFDIK